MKTICLILIYLLAPATLAYSRIELVAAVLMAEARGEGLDGLKAVAEVIRNRGSDPAAVVTKRKQFSCLNRVTPESLIVSMKRKAGWSIAYELADLLYSDPARLGNRTRGANHYYATSIKPPYWADLRKRTVQIGNHIFFKL